MNRGMVYRGRRGKTEESPVLKMLANGAVEIWKRIAHIERLLRNDKPRGVISNITAKPKGRGLTPRHELWAD